MSDTEIERWFSYHPPTPEQSPRYQNIRDMAMAMAHCIVLNAPGGPDRAAALTMLRQTVMMANAAIALNGNGG